MAGDRKTPFPSREQVRSFLAESPGPVQRREVARAFNIRGSEDRRRLNALLRELKAEGQESADGSGALPSVAVLRITGLDTDGEMLAAPASWRSEGAPPRIAVTPGARGRPGLAAGDRILAKLTPLDEGGYMAETIRQLDRQSATRSVGVFRQARRESWIEPADKRRADPIRVAEAPADLSDRDLVIFTLESGRLGPRRVRIVERLGRSDDPSAISAIAIASARIPTEFSREALAQAEAAKPVELGSRTDFRNLPLVTIDGPDARDFDDAVYAEPDDDPANAGGWRLVVAIADVAAYVTPGSALDQDAIERGNSCYFPDRVVPMLPEALSNGLCSLTPGEDRACFVCEMTINREGELRRHRFTRGLMRSAARLTYEALQAAADGRPDETTRGLLERVIEPLYGAFRSLTAARAARGTLDLDLPERQITLSEAGDVAAVTTRPHLDSHRLIEEFMIAANVAAAETLMARRAPALFRVHDEPDRARIQALRDYLRPLGYNLALGQVAKPIMFSQILAGAEGRPEAETISQMVLRAQAQAVYQPQNIGHFGLALPAYAHFTAPIRRYADLIVHRALIAALEQGADGGIETPSRLEEIGVHLSMTERRAAAAERDATDRYLAAYLAPRVGETFSARVTGVTHFGLFATLDESGADGLIPVSTLPDDRYDHDEAAHALVGRRSGRVFVMGSRVKVRLVEADPLTASTLLQLISVEEAPQAVTGKRKRRRKGRS